MNALAVRRNTMLMLQDRVQRMPGAFGPEAVQLEHTFTDGVYTRTMFAPAGVLLIGEIHKQRHLCLLMRGRVTFVGITGEPQHVEAPARWVAEPGEKRAILVHEDCEWSVVHGTHETDIGKIRSEVIAEDFDEADAALIERAFACLG